MNDLSDSVTAMVSWFFAVIFQVSTKEVIKFQMVSAQFSLIQNKGGSQVLN